MSRDISVVGGGLGGLVAAVAAAEAGARVTVYESHHTVGGRARSTAAPYIANEGPHVFYADGPHWTWLKRRGLVPAARLGAAEAAGLRFRRDARLGRLPTAGVLRAAAARGLHAPVEESFTDWAGRRFGPDTARRIASMMGVVTFDADPGRLSAAFVWERFQRVTRPGFPAARYVRGGWQTVVDRLVSVARSRGVVIETGTRVDRLPEPPVIVATALPAARTLLGDDTLVGESGHTLLFDLAVRRRPADAFLVFDLDEAGFVERYTGPDPSLAPPGESLVQAQLPLRPGESRKGCQSRLESMLDLAVPGWRDRETWRRTQVAKGRTGALDLPGATWRDRPSVDRGGDVYLVGDEVAAPGLLSEVTLAGARQAAAWATGTRRSERSPA
jgi:phytoene dehydrogenase-like protein